MNSNWRKPEEAREYPCLMRGLLLAIEDITGNAEGTALCNADECPFWLWRPCYEYNCNGRGTTGPIAYDDCGQRVDGPEICRACNNTGHDGSGLGRCGLVRGQL